jgi:hypothetical protein
LKAELCSRSECYQTPENPPKDSHVTSSSNDHANMEIDLPYTANNKEVLHEKYLSLFRKHEELSKIYSKTIIAHDDLKRKYKSLKETCKGWQRFVDEHWAALSQLQSPSPGQNAQHTAKCVVGAPCRIHLAASSATQIPSSTASRQQLYVADMLTSNAVSPDSTNQSRPSLTDENSSAINCNRSVCSALFDQTTTSAFDKKSSEEQENDILIKHARIVRQRKRKQVRHADIDEHGTIAVKSETNPNHVKTESQISRIDHGVPLLCRVTTRSDELDLDTDGNDPYTPRKRIRYLGIEQYPFDSNGRNVANDQSNDPPLYNRLERSLSADSDGDRDSGFTSLSPVPQVRTNSTEDKLVQAKDVIQAQFANNNNAVFLDRYGSTNVKTPDKIGTLQDRMIHQKKQAGKIDINSNAIKLLQKKDQSFWEGPPCKSESGEEPELKTEIQSRSNDLHGHKSSLFKYSTTGNGTAQLLPDINSNDNQKVTTFKKESKASISLQYATITSSETSLRVSDQRIGKVSASACSSKNSNKLSTSGCKATRLRDLPLERLSVSDFKPNPALVYNKDVGFAFCETVRSRDSRNCLPGCTKSECCGRSFRALVEAGLPVVQRSLLQTSQDSTDGTDDDEKLLQEYLGNSYEENMSSEQRNELLMEARTKKTADTVGKHKHAFERRTTPPGFWRADMASTQEIEIEKAASKDIKRARLHDMRREALREGGRWVFRDE